MLEVSARKHRQRQRDLLHGREGRASGRRELDVLLDEIDDLEHVVLGEPEVAVELFVAEVGERVVPLPEDSGLLGQDSAAPAGDRFGLFLQLRPLHFDVLDAVFDASAAGAQREKIQLRGISNTPAHSSIRTETRALLEEELQADDFIEEDCVIVSSSDHTPAAGNSHSLLACATIRIKTIKRQRRKRMR